MDNKLFDKFGKDQLSLNILKALKDKIYKINKSKIKLIFEK